MEGRIELEISGLGIIMYSPFAVAHLSEGEDYLSSSYMDYKLVLEHVYSGTIVGFGTSSPGRYMLLLHEGYPENEVLMAAKYKLRLGIEVRDETLCFGDLYHLMDWVVNDPETPRIHLEDGFYHVTLHGNPTPSGRLGDNQEIHVYLKKLDSMPELHFHGIPTLCID